MKTTLERGNEKQIPPIGLRRKDSAVVQEEPRVAAGADRWAAACASAGAAVSDTLLAFGHGSWRQRSTASTDSDHQ